MDVPTPVPVHLLSQLLVHAHRQLEEKGVEGFNVLACELGGGEYALMTAGLSRVLSGEVLMFVREPELATGSACIAEVAHGLCGGEIDFLQAHVESGARIAVVPQMLQPTLGEGSALIENIVSARVMIPPTFFEVVPLGDTGPVGAARDRARLPRHTDVHFLPHGTLQEFRDTTDLLLGAMSGGRGVPDARQVLDFLEMLADEADEDGADEDDGEEAPQFHELDLASLPGQDSRPAPYVISGFGAVSASVHYAEIGDDADYECPSPDEVQWFKVHFQLPEGTVASQMSVVAYIEGDDDIPQAVASRCEDTHPWLSTIFGRDETPLPVARATWGSDVDLGPDLGLITGVWIAPAFADAGLLRHMLEFVAWLMKATNATTPCLTIELNALDASFEPESMSDSVRAWYETHLVGMGARRAGRVDHNWGTDAPPRWCDHHGPYYLLPGAARA